MQQPQEREPRQAEPFGRRSSRRRARELVRKMAMLVRVVSMLLKLAHPEIAGHGHGHGHET